VLVKAKFRCRIASKVEMSHPGAVVRLGADLSPGGVATATQTPTGGKSCSKTPTLESLGGGRRSAQAASLRTAAFISSSVKLLGLFLPISARFIRGFAPEFVLEGMCPQRRSSRWA